MYLYLQNRIFCDWKLKSVVDWEFGSAFIFINSDIQDSEILQGLDEFSILKIIMLLKKLAKTGMSVTLTFCSWFNCLWLIVSQIITPPSWPPLTTKLSCLLKAMDKTGSVSFWLYLCRTFSENVPKHNLAHIILFYMNRISYSYPSLFYTHLWIFQLSLS